MPTFPAREPDIVALADTMLSGYLAHVDDFPSAIKPQLNQKINACKAAINAQLLARAAFRVASAAKRQSLENLTGLMKKDLKISEVDTIDQPEKLTEIGWAPRQNPQPVAAPGQPLNLHPVAEGQGMLWLSWDSPATGSGGPVRNYIIQRRRQPDNNPPGQWILAGTAFDNGVELANQPRVTKLEYRIIASNSAGQSLPSNTINVVL